MFTLLYVWEYSRFAPETANECTASSIIIRAREVPYFKADGVADDIYALILLHADWVRRYSMYIYMAIRLRPHACMVTHYFMNISTHTHTFH